ncbi:hypothetical protein V2J09_004159, partial [Rumex salicifolius]
LINNCCSNNILTTTLNALILVLSVPILATGIWLRQNAATVCDSLLEKKLIVLSVFLLAFSIAGIVGACFNVRWLLWGYYIVMMLVVLILLGSISFVFVVTYKGSGEEIDGKVYREYRSFYLQKRVVYDWDAIKRCLMDGNACERLIDDHSINTVDQFYAHKLSPIEPSNDCGFTFVSPTNWTNPTPYKMANILNPDCALWSNNKSALCYECDACKAGVLQSIKSYWRNAAFISIVFLLVVFILIICVSACFSFATT